MESAFGMGQWLDAFHGGQMSAAVIPDEAVFERVVNAVIIYDDFASATEANAMLERAIHRAGEIAEWHVKPWRLGLLNQPSIAAEALKDAEDAHLIVFALRPDCAYPLWLFEWLEKWAAQRRIGEAALALFIGRGSDASAAPMVPELPQFAKRHGLNFIFDNRSTHTPALNPPRQVAAIPVAEQLAIEESAHEHWGINE